MGMFTHGKRPVSAINVTPLVDVVLVLLIIFMVVTPLLQRGKSVPLPEARRISELRAGDPILIAVTRDGRTWIGEAEVARRDLAEALSRQLARRSAPVVLKADKDLDYRTVRQVMLEISKTRLAGLSLAAREPGQGGGR